MRKKFFITVSAALSIAAAASLAGCGDLGEETDSNQTNQAEVNETSYADSTAESESKTNESDIETSAKETQDSLDEGDKDISTQTSSQTEASTLSETTNEQQGTGETSDTTPADANNPEQGAAKKGDDAQGKPRVPSAADTSSVWGDIQVEECVLGNGAHIYIPVIEYWGHYEEADTLHVGVQDDVVIIKAFSSDTAPAEDANTLVKSVGEEGSGYYITFSPALSWDDDSRAYANDYFDKISKTAWVE